MSQPSIGRAMKAVVFDLGDTLVEYEGLPPSWEDHYDSALAALAESAGCDVCDETLVAARGILRNYNTRLNPRTREVPFSLILVDLMAALKAKGAPEVDAAAVAFFSVFRQRLRCFPDTKPVLSSLRSADVRIGVLTDVPYGMPRGLVEEDMAAAGVLELVNALVTSVDARVRKPAPGGLELLASRLQSSPSEMVFVGNEKKDVEVALSFGCEAVLLDRSGAGPKWRQHRTIATLTEL
jgi:putative hydrolase of the HAD superfamily